MLHSYQPLAQEALKRNAGHIRSLYIGTPGMLHVLVDALPCTQLVSLECNLANLSWDTVNMLVQLIRRNPGLRRVYFYGVDAWVNLQQLALALQTCQGLTHFHLCCLRDQTPGVNFRVLASLIHGLTYPHFRLKSLHLDVLVKDPPDNDWALVKANRQNSTPLFPNLESLFFDDSGRHCQQSAEALFLPVLSEAPELKILSIPEMSDSATVEASVAIRKQTLRLESLTFNSSQSHQAFADIVKTSRRTLRRIDALPDNALFCETMLQALIPTNNDTTNICLQTNLQRIEIALHESPTVSTVIQKILTSLPNLRSFGQGWMSSPVVRTHPGRLEICDMVATPWVCLGLRALDICLGCHTVEGGVETERERQAEIGKVYKQLGALIRLEHLTLGCDILGESSKVELDFTLETGFEAMKPCLKHLLSLDISRVAGSQFSQKERDWMQEHAPRVTVTL
ncbi:hypothetical protein BGZ52_013099 [Haplosporangium bisporale]|nr:hypothetical protein BGZ52_013099 [Haplosporangium bisporale]KFH64488.1 hypothetical protein MVEG_09222 [Podila verticillata NRRL 6337]